MVLVVSGGGGWGCWSWPRRACPHRASWERLGLQARVCQVPERSHEAGGIRPQGGFAVGSGVWLEHAVQSPVTLTQLTSHGPEPQPGPCRPAPAPRLVRKAGTEPAPGWEGRGVCTAASQTGSLWVWPGPHPCHSPGKSLPSPSVMAAGSRGGERPLHQVARATALPSVTLSDRVGSRVSISPGPSGHQVSCLLPRGS